MASAFLPLVVSYDFVKPTAVPWLKASPVLVFKNGVSWDSASKFLLLASPCDSMWDLS